MEPFLSPGKDVSNLFETLRRAGYKVTQARRMVIETLSSEMVHLTAPDLVKAVQKRAPGIGRASVYRTLELLTRLGLVQSSTLGGGAATYVLTPSKHHHHAVCIECHKTVEFDECVLRELEGRLAKTLGFQFEGHLVELYGRCPDCLL
jgi:Fur family ferric uptake transcriptional regulator